MSSHRPSSRRFVSNSPDETRSLGARLGKKLKKGDVILLKATLGAGKTTFVQGLVRQLSGREAAVSPTFILAQTYAAPIPVHHLDFYRASPKELLEAGVQDYLSGTGELEPGIVLIEWADRCPDLWPAERIKIDIRIETGSKKRILNLTATGKRLKKIIEDLK